MTVSLVRGEGNALVVSPDSEPDFAGDLTAISLDVSRRANTLSGARSDRIFMKADEKWIGLEYYETDTGENYRFTENGWRRSDGQVAWTYSYYHPNGTDGADLIPVGKWTEVVPIDIPDAKAGAYLIHCSGSWWTAESGVETVGYSRVTVDAANVGPDQVMTVTKAGASLARTVALENYPGGSMRVRLALNPASVTCGHWNGGLGIVVQYLGPNA
jgi:hypothetical protein